MDQPLKIKVLRQNSSQVEITDGRYTRVISRQTLHNLISAKKVKVDMVECRCVQKIRNKRGIITHYRIVDSSGNSLVIEKGKLKNLIYEYKIDCLNLTLTQDKRLVVKGIPDEKMSIHADKKNETLEKCVLSQSLIQGIIKGIRAGLNARIVELRFIGKSNESINDNIYNQAKDIANTRLKYVSKVVGNSKDTVSVAIFPKRGIEIQLPENCDGLFLNSETLGIYDVYNLRTSGDSGRRFNRVVLDGLDWQNVKTAVGMFLCTQIENLVIRNQRADNLRDIQYFAKLQALESVDMQQFIAPNLKKAVQMFECCEALNICSIKLGSLDLSNLRAANTAKMFKIDIALNHFYLLKGLLNIQEDVEIPTNVSFKHCELIKYCVDCAISDVSSAYGLSVNRPLNNQDDIHNKAVKIFYSSNNMDESSIGDSLIDTQNLDNNIGYKDKSYESRELWRSDIDRVFNTLYKALVNLSDYKDIKQAADTKDRLIIHIYGNSSMVQKKIRDESQSSECNYLRLNIKVLPGTILVNIFPDDKYQLEVRDGIRLFNVRQLLNMYMETGTRDNTFGIKQASLRIQALVIDGVNFEKLENASQMFAFTQIESLIIKNQEAPKLTKMDYFGHMQALEYVSLSGFRSAQVESANRMFGNCLALRPWKIDIRDIQFKEQGNTQTFDDRYIYSMFYSPIAVNHFYNFNQCIQVSEVEYANPLLNFSGHTKLRMNKLNNDLDFSSKCNHLQKYIPFYERDSDVLEYQYRLKNGKLSSRVKLDANKIAEIGRRYKKIDYPIKQNSLLGHKGLLCKGSIKERIEYLLHPESTVTTGEVREIKDYDSLLSGDAKTSLIDAGIKSQIGLYNIRDHAVKNTGLSYKEIENMIYLLGIRKKSTV